MNTQYQEANYILKRLEQILQQLNMWDETPPSAEALASNMPFCYDTLEFHQWLQWVFIPKTNALMDAGATLPNSSGIAPLAQEVYKDRLEEMSALIDILAAFDRLITEDD